MDTVKRIYQTLDKIEDKVYKVCAALGAAAMSIASIAIFLQVLYRYVLSRFVNLPFAFTEELARYCLFWIIYLLLPCIIKEGMEASNTFFPSMLKGKAKSALYLIVWGVCTLVATIAFIYSFSTLRTNWNFSSPVMGLPGFFHYRPVAIGMGMVVLHYIIEILGFVCGERQAFENIGKGGVE